MHPELNPYSPGAGRRPPNLVGRQADIDAFDLLVVRTRAGQIDRGMVMHGLRGVGKTVLLNRFKGQAEQAGWMILELEGARPRESTATSGTARLARELAKLGRKVRRGNATRDQALGAISSFASLHGAGGDVPFDLLKGRADSGDLEVDLAEVVDDLLTVLPINTPSAVALFVDELQDLESNLLDAILAVQHRAGQNGRPFYVVGAGLQDLPSRLSDLRSYSDRLFDYRPIGQLSPDDSRAALVEPAQNHGASYSDEALDTILTAADGYPYFLQTFGRATWNAATSRSINVDDAEEGVRVGREELDGGFYPARWTKATMVERRYLGAMGTLGKDECRTSEIGEVLNVPLSKLSTVRQQLLDKGMLSAPARGVVAFTVPGMRAFVERQFIE